MNQIRPERGEKRTCQSCEARFYDLSRVPIVCPKCGADYIEIIRPVPTPYQRRGRGVFGRSDPTHPLPVEASEAPEPAEEEEEEGERELDGESEPEDEVEEVEE